MIKSLLLIFSPARTWDGIVEDRRNVWFILFLFLMPLAALSTAGECYGLTRWGKFPGGLQTARVFAWEEIRTYAALQFGLSIAVAFLAARFIQYLGETFRGERDFTHAFRLVGYAVGPLYLCRLLDAIPVMPWWVTWAIGIVFTISTMYHGVPRVMDPDPPQAFGLYVTSAFLVAIVSGLARFVNAWWLLGLFNKADAARLGGGQLPF